MLHNFPSYRIRHRIRVWRYRRRYPWHFHRGTAPTEDRRSRGDVRDAWTGESGEKWVP